MDANPRSGDVRATALPLAHVPKVVAEPSRTACGTPRRPFAERSSSVHLCFSGLIGDKAPRVLRSDDGSLSFAIVPLPTGLLVERRHSPSAGVRTAQAMIFESVYSFDRWCDSEPVRFLDPLLHALLRRDGHETLGAVR